MSDTTPQDFDFDAWLDGAERPERSVTVYQKAGLIADLDALEEQIQNAEAAEDLEPSLTEVGEARNLRAKYAKLAQQFHDSALTIRVQGRTLEERAKLHADNKDLEAVKLGAVVIADALVYPKATPQQVEKLKTVIGDAQFSRIVAAYNQANNEFPVVSADFLPKPSTRDDGGES